MVSFHGFLSPPRYLSQNRREVGVVSSRGRQTSRLVEVRMNQTEREEVATAPQPESNIEVEKRLRSLFGLWKVREILQKEYPEGIILLMDSSASFDVLVIDEDKGEIVAVEVKATRPGSGSRHLTSAQKRLKLLLNSKDAWKVKLEKYALYGEPGEKAIAKRVPDLEEE